MLPSASRFAPLAKAIFVPSGDQAGWRQPSADGSELAPPQADAGWTLRSRNPLPSLRTMDIELCTSGVTCRENAISFPCGDQSNVQQLVCNVGGKIHFRPVPLTLIPNTPSILSGPKRWSTIRLPSDDRTPAT